jgi:integrase
MFRFLAATCLRWSELVALQWRHLQVGEPLAIDAGLAGATDGAPSVAELAQDASPAITADVAL